MDKKSADELRDECKKRGLKKYGRSKASMIAAITADDTAKASKSDDDREDTPEAAASADAVEPVTEISKDASPDSASRDKRARFYQELHDLIWVNAGLEPHDSLDHMVFFFTLYELEHYIDHNETFGPNCKWSVLIANLDCAPRLFEMVFGRGDDSAIEILARHPQTAPAFRDFMRKIERAEIVREVIDTINRFAVDESSDTLGELFQYTFGRGGETVPDSGAYFTSRAICRVAFNLAYAIRGSILRDDGTLCTVFDPFCGSGGFLSEFAKGVNEKSTEPRDWTRDCSRVFGCDISQRCVRLAMINMLISTGVPFDDTTIKRADSFHEDIMRSQVEREEGETDDEYAMRENIVLPNLRDLGGVDFGMSNPPYGADKKMKCFEGTGRDKKCILSADIRSVGVVGEIKRAAYGLELCMSTLAPRGVQCVVMPEGFFTNTGIYAALRRKLIEDYCVHYVVSIPNGTFIGTGVKTAMIIFQAGVGPTENVRFMRLIGDVADCTDYEVADEYTITVETLREHSFNLSAKSYTRKIRACLDVAVTCEHKMRDIVELSSGKSIIIDKTLSKGFPIYGGGEKMRYYSETFNRSDAFVVARVGGAGITQFAGGCFHLTDCGWTITIKNRKIANETFVGCYLIRNVDITKTAVGGSVQPVINTESFGELPIFLPPIEIQRIFANAARPLLQWIEREKLALESAESHICGSVREMKARFRAQIPTIAFGDLIEIVKHKGHAVSEGVDVRSDTNRYPLLRSSRDGKIKWLPTCDITERLIAMGNGGEANVSMCENFNISTHYITFRAREQVLLPFLYYAIKSSIAFINRTFFGGTCLQNLRSSQLMEWQVVIPPLEVQHELDAEFTEAWNKKLLIDHLKLKLDQLMERYIPRAEITEDIPCAPGSADDANEIASESTSDISEAPQE